MKDARELLQKLRAAGVEPMTDAEITKTVEWRMPYDACARRLALSALEAREKLAEVRAWAETIAVFDDDEIGFRSDSREILEILDREPTS